MSIEKIIEKVDAIEVANQAKIVEAVEAVKAEFEEKWQGNFQLLDVTDKEKFKKIITENKINNIIHLASIHSLDSEKNLELAKLINIQGVHNSLDLARETNSL